MTDSTPWTELVKHATAKLAEEQRFHDAHARAGRKVHGRRIDRRPLWDATIHLAEALAQKPPADPTVRDRVAAWRWLCDRAVHLTAEEHPPAAVVELARVLSLPAEERKATLAERAAVREQRAEERRRSRAEFLREELRRLEGEAPDPSGGNVIPFRVRATG